MISKTLIDEHIYNIYIQIEHRTCLYVRYTFERVSQRLQWFSEHAGDLSTFLYQQMCFPISIT